MMFSTNRLVYENCGADAAWVEDNAVGFCSGLMNVVKLVWTLHVPTLLKRSYLFSLHI